MKIIGLDPGLARCGWGSILLHKRGDHHVEHGCITTDQSLNPQSRLLQLRTYVKQLIKMQQPNAIAIEQLVFGKMVSTIVIVAEARGAILTACAEYVVPVYDYHPSQIKRLVAHNGVATKAEMIEAVAFTLNIPRIEQDDANDGVAIALAHLISTGKWLEHKLSAPA